jgi:predicted MPP superfamily phosphohydrolase
MMVVRRRRLKAWPVLGITFIQAILLAAHWFIYRTFVDFWFPLSPAWSLALRAAVIPLSVSFLAAALLGFRFSNPPIRLFYSLSSVWLGVMNYLFLAACLCWPVDLLLRLASGNPHRPLIAAVLFSLALVTSTYGLLNARWIRLRRIAVRLANFPQSWRGRTAVMASDLHLGNLNGLAFSRRIASMIAALKPDIVFIPGDLFDGSGANPDKLAAPFRELKPPLGIFYVTGNHEEFGHAERYTQAVARAGIHVLTSEKAVVDGVSILGIPYRDSTYPIRVKAALDSLHPERGQPAILLLHAPTRLPIVEQAGVTMQLSGHTHKGQFFPFTWLTRRVFGKFTYGLQQFGSLTVYTSCGAGTWGPPMRVGTDPEIVQITFE